MKKTDIPPLAYDPFSESGGEEEITAEDEWTFPRLPDELAYEKYPRVGPGLIGKTGSIKLLAQPSFELKPMIEESVITKQGVFKSTYSCYLRKVTSHIVAWTGCISIRILRSYRRKNDDDWIRLYNYCLRQTGLDQSHLFLSTQEVAALCAALSDPNTVKALLKPVTSSTFLNQAATSSTDSLAASGNTRITATGLFTDFNIIKNSKKGLISNIQSVLGDYFYWTNLQHHAFEEVKYPHKARCLHAIASAAESAKMISQADENTQARASIHIWLSFAEYERWNNRGTEASFVFNGVYEDVLKDSLCSLVRESCMPVFVSFGTASEFHHGGEMQMERTIDRIALELSRAGVAISINQLMWVECSNFTDVKFHACNPKTLKPSTDGSEQWNRNTAFSCLDKSLFREKMLYACVVGDSTITEMENAFSSVAMDAVLSEPPPEVRFVSPAEKCERIPIEKLRKMRTISPLLNADFNAVGPKIVRRDDRFWYVVPPRPRGQSGKYYQESPSRMVMCYMCSNDKADGNHYDVNEMYAGVCPNCASNFCRAFYFSKQSPAEADVAFRWAASIYFFARTEGQFRMGKDAARRQHQRLDVENHRHISYASVRSRKIRVTLWYNKNAL